MVEALMQGSDLLEAKRCGASPLCCVAQSA